jgi:hypothetical protein
MLTMAFSIQSVKANGTVIAVIKPETGKNEFVFNQTKTYINQTFSANITITDVEDLGGWQLNLTWDPTLIKINTTDDMYRPADAVFGATANETKKEIGDGQMFWAVSRGAGDPTFNGSGTLGQINFTIVRNDTGGFLHCGIHFVVEGEGPQPTKLVNGSREVIPYIPSDGIYEMLPDHGIGITGITSSKTVVEHGLAIFVNVTILNYGLHTETFNVTVRANATKIGEQDGLHLSSRNSTTRTFKWNTTGSAKGNYNVSAYATPVIGETYLDDNILANWWVFVTIEGDVNGDRKVDISDLTITVDAIPSIPGQPNWNPNADINGDGFVDLADIVKCIKNLPSKW